MQVPMGCSASVARPGWVPPQNFGTSEDLANVPKPSEAPPSPTPGPGTDVETPSEITGASIRDLYDFCEVLGRGGYSIVRSAINRKTGQKVAVKVITMSATGGSRKEFRAKIADLSRPADARASARAKGGAAKQTVSVLKSVMNEIDTLRALDHPSLCKLLDHFLEESPTGKAYLVMELLTGGDLAQLLNARGKLTHPEARTVFYRVMSGLEYVHRKGFVHRDLKLENVMLARPNDLASATIADFGLACRVRETGPGVACDPSALVTICGTPVYMPPEMIRAVKRGARNGQPSKWFASRAQDMWSSGVVLHALLTGFFPYETTEVGERLFNHILGLAPRALAGPHWDGVPAHARQLVVDLLHPFEDARPSALRALRSPWLAAVCRGSAEDVERMAAGRASVDAESLRVSLSSAGGGEGEVTDSARDSESTANGGSFWEVKGGGAGGASGSDGSAGGGASSPVGSDADPRGSRARQPSSSAASLHAERGPAARHPKGSSGDLPRPPATPPVGAWWVGNPAAQPTAQPLCADAHPSQDSSGSAFRNWLVDQADSQPAADGSASPLPAAPRPRLDEVWGVPVLTKGRGSAQRGSVADSCLSLGGQSHRASCAGASAGAAAGGGRALSRRHSVVSEGPEPPAPPPPAAALPPELIFGTVVPSPLSALLDSPPGAPGLAPAEAESQLLSAKRVATLGEAGEDAWDRAGAPPAPAEAQPPAAAEAQPPAAAVRAQLVATSWLTPPPARPSGDPGAHNPPATPAAAGPATARRMSTLGEVDEPQEDGFARAALPPPPTVAA